MSVEELLEIWEKYDAKIASLDLELTKLYQQREQCMQELQTA